MAGASEVRATGSLDVVALSSTSRPAAVLAVGADIWLAIRRGAAPRTAHVRRGVAEPIAATAAEGARNTAINSDSRVSSRPQLAAGDPKACQRRAQEQAQVVFVHVCAISEMRVAATTGQRQQGRRTDDMTVNVCKTKQLTNMRASSSDTTVTFDTFPLA